VVTSTANRPTVLIVDDNQELLLTTSRYLMARGFHVLTADSPLGVTNIVRREVPDVIVLDVMMPALSGDALAKILRGLALPKTPAIVFYSALDEESLHRLTRGVENATYVSKASSVEELRAVIQEILAARRE